MTVLWHRFEPVTRALLDLALVGCLVLLWITGATPLLVHVAYVFGALSAFARPSVAGVLVRGGAVTLIGTAAMLHGHSSTSDVLEVPLLAALALLFAVFVRKGQLTERAILLEKAHLARLIDGLPLPMIALDKDALVVSWNTAAERLFGWTAAEAIGKSNPIVPSEERLDSNKLFARIYSGEQVRGVEVTRKASDGTELELAVYSAPVKGLGTLVLYDDIRERKLAERERDEAQRRYRELVESVPLVTYIDLVDDHATNVYTSPQVADILGWSPTEWETDARLYENILHPEDSERVMAEVRYANATHEPFDSQYRLRHRDGHYVWVRDQSAILNIDGEEFARGFLLDITKQKQLEEQLQQAQKMDALGQFAGGIAHDFNNLLTGIGGYAELAASTTERGTVVSRCLDGIRTATHEAANLTSRLLAFSRRNVPEREPVDLNAIVREAASLLERLVRSDVRVTLALANPLPAVAADLAQLKQVILNLAVNARDAMPDGGELKIETAVSGTNVIVRVRDDGVGMDAVTKSRAFEPFFTTKPEGEGSGLGLSLVYSVVDGLDGRVSIESAIGRGTIVEIAIPAADALPDELEEAGNEGAVATSGERVLVVEDRDVVRELAREVLEASGFNVVAVAGGREALAVAATDEPFDLLLTDVVMPEMSGPELAVKLRVQQPLLPVLYMSGYTDDVLSAHELSQEATAFLRKPFGNAELITAARELLVARPWAPIRRAKVDSSA